MKILLPIFKGCAFAAWCLIVYGWMSPAWA